MTAIVYTILMNRVIYEKKNKHLDQSLIPNTIIERLFMSIADDEQMRIYIEKANSNTPAIRASATAYASSKIERIFMYFRDDYIKKGGDLEYLNFSLWRKNK